MLYHLRLNYVSSVSSGHFIYLYIFGYTSILSVGTHSLLLNSSYFIHPCQHFRYYSRHFFSRNKFNFVSSSSQPFVFWFSSNFLERLVLYRLHTYFKHIPLQGWIPISQCQKLLEYCNIFLFLFFKIKTTGPTKISGLDAPIASVVNALPLPLQQFSQIVVICLFVSILHSAGPWGQELCYLLHR